MEFGEKDRELILKIAKQVEALKKDHESRLVAVEDALKKKKKDKKATPSPIQPRKIPVQSQFSEDIPFGAMEDGDESSIQIRFKNGQVDVIQHQILVESLYATLRQLCEDNDIEQLFIRINETAK